MLALLLLACTPDVLGLYEEERREALEVASERPRDWSPDLRIQIGPKDFEAAVGTAVAAAVSDPEPLVVALPLGMEARVRPRDLVVERAKVRPVDDCDACLGLDAVVNGRATWAVAGMKGDFPFEVGIDSVLALEVADGRTVRARPRSVAKVRVKVGDLEGLRGNPSKEIQEWVQRAWGREVPSITLVDLDPADLPLRDLRLRTSSGLVVLEALTDVPGAKPVLDAEPITEGVRVSVSETALAGLARRAAFEKGVLAMDVAADPRALTVDGDAFTLQLRLWRLVGRGWWRDYVVTGTLAIEGGKLVLKPTETKEIGASPGAGLVDPLPVLFQGRVLEAITDAVRQTLPASRAQDLGTVRMKAEAQQVSGKDGTLRVDGLLTVKAPEQR